MIKENKAQCKLCGDIIESKDIYDFVMCKCGEIFVDGGTDFLRRGSNNPDNFIELSIKDDEIFIVDLGELIDE